LIELIDVIWLLLAGLAGGFIAGLLGIGGGVIYVLIFTSYLTFLAPQAIPGDILVRLTIANSVFALLFAGLAGCIKQYKIKNFYPLIFLLIGIPAILSSIIVTFILSLTDQYSTRAFTIVFILMLIPIIIRMLLKKKSKIKSIEKIYPPYIYIIIGVVSGSATALSGLGGGFIIVPVLTGLLKLKVKKAISISLGVIAVVSFGLSIYNFTAFDYHELELPYTIGAITLPMVLPVIGGVILATPIGVYAGQRIPGFYLRIFFAVFCIAVIIKMIAGIV